MDYAMLARNSIQSTSDQEDYRNYATISANAVIGVTPEQARKMLSSANYFGTNASGDTSSEDYLTTAQNYVSSFEDGTRLELQFLDRRGR